MFRLRGRLRGRELIMDGAWGIYLLGLGGWWGKLDHGLGGAEACRGAVAFGGADRLAWTAQ